MRIERCAGLTPYAADSRHLDDLPDALYTTSPYGPKVQRTVTRMWTKIKSGT